MLSSNYVILKLKEHNYMDIDFIFFFFVEVLHTLSSQIETL